MQNYSFKAVLCDIGGVLYVGDRVVEGAVEAIDRLKENYPVRFLTNTTQKTADQVVKKLRDLGFHIEPHEIITALNVTRTFLEQQRSSAYFILTNDAEKFFDDLGDLSKRYVVIGDAQDNFSYQNMNAAFRQLQEGSELIAAAKNRYFKNEDGTLSMDAGCFVSALEYASGQEARIIGKPSREFYHLACDGMGISPEDIVMIGDDIESDILGAQNAGLRAILVRTGKFSPNDLTRGIKPDKIIDSISCLPRSLKPHET